MNKDRDDRGYTLLERMTLRLMMEHSRVILACKSMGDPDTVRHTFTQTTVLHRAAAVLGLATLHGMELGKPTDVADYLEAHDEVDKQEYNELMKPVAEAAGGSPSTVAVLLGELLSKMKDGPNAKKCGKCSEPLCDECNECHECEQKENARMHAN